jgi:hypothetical protein
MRHLLILPLLLASVACEEKKPDWARQGAPGVALAPQDCAKVKAGLDNLAKGGFDYTDKGEGTLPTEAWAQMPPSQRDQLASTLAYHASCVAGATSDQQGVVIRGEDGTQLLRRTLSTKVDAGELLGGE